MSPPPRASLNWVALRIIQTLGLQSLSSRDSQEMRVRGVSSEKTSEKGLFTCLKRWACMSPAHPSNGLG